MAYNEEFWSITKKYTKEVNTSNKLQAFIYAFNLHGENQIHLSIFCLTGNRNFEMYMTWHEWKLIKILRVKIRSLTSKNKYAFTFHIFSNYKHTNNHIVTACIQPLTKTHTRTKNSIE